MLILFKLGKEYIAFICILILCDLAVKCVISSPSTTGTTKLTSNRHDETNFDLGPNEFEVKLKSSKQENEERKGFEEKAEKEELQKEVKEEDYGTEVQKKIKKIMETMTNERLKNDLIDSNVVENIKKAFDRLYANDWKLYNQYSNGDKIETKEVDGHTIYRGTVFLDVSAETVMEELYDKFEQQPEWNKSYITCKVIAKIGKDTDVTYREVKLGWPNSNRDFVIFRHKSKFGDTNVVVNMSMDCYCDPVINNPNDNVRGYTGPSCSVMKPLGPNKCMQLVLLDNDLKGNYSGKIPPAVFTFIQNRYMSNLRDHFTKLQSKIIPRFNT